MRFPAQCALACIAMWIALAPRASSAQGPAPADPEREVPAAATDGEPKTLTGKERLGKKWQDEQRIDNCNVPPDKRGTKQRPDTCTPKPEI